MATSHARCYYLMVWGLGSQGSGFGVQGLRARCGRHAPYTELHGAGVRGWESVQVSGEEPGGEGGRGEGRAGEREGRARRLAGRGREGEDTSARPPTLIYYSSLRCEERKARVQGAGCSSGEEWKVEGFSRVKVGGFQRNSWVPDCSCSGPTNCSGSGSLFCSW